MRHVSRTHRVALDWLFDRINVEPEIHIKYADTKNQLADMLTKRSCTRDEWNHLLRLFNIVNFSMFSCNHFSSILCDSIRKQSAMSKRGQEVTSSGSSPMAKPEPLIPATARPIYLVLHNSLSARKNPPQDLRDPMNPGNVDEERGGHSSSGKLVRTDQSQDPIEYSQVRRQKSTQHANSWKQEDRDESSNSTGSGKLLRTVNTKTEFQIMKFTNHQHINEGFPIFAKEVGNHNRLLNICNGSITVQCIDMGIVHVFVNEKQPFTLDEIIWKIWKNTRTRTS